jgi:leucyl-tRNA synthetase
VATKEIMLCEFLQRQNGISYIKNIFNQDISEAAYGAKEGFQLVDSDF